MNQDKPIALQAYEALAERFSQMAQTKAENGYLEYPAIRKQIGEVSGQKVLEAGCGPGYLIEYLLGKGAAVTAFDITPKMIEIAQNRNPGTKILRHDMAEPFLFMDSNQVDLVVSSLAIDYVCDWSRPLSEFHRVLRPGGRLIFSAQHPMGSYDLYKPNSAFGVQYVEAVWADFGGEPVVVPDYYRSFAEIINPVLKAGFDLKEVVETRPVEELKHRSPDMYERLNRQASFMIIEAVKKQASN